MSNLGTAVGTALTGRIPQALPAVRADLQALNWPLTHTGDSLGLVYFSWSVNILSCRRSSASPSSSTRYLSAMSRDSKPVNLP